MTETETDLTLRIDELRMTIATDSFPMSIGELANLYRDGELNVHPEFQRAFRWSLVQKSRLVESILLGIPLPSIFVAQDENGHWDVVDGVQRLSTILEFMGYLKDEYDVPVEPMRCVATPYLKDEIEGVSFEEPAPCLSPPHRIDFRRTRIDIQIIKRQSSPRGKFDLFQRLNSYGSVATPQELRNALLIAANSKAYEWLKALSDRPAYRSVMDFSQKNIDEKYHMDLALRFVHFRRLPLEHLSEIKNNLHEYLSDQVVVMADRPNDWYDTEGEAFAAVFDALEEAGGADTLRRYNVSKERAEGGLSLTAFEVIALGLGYNWANTEFTSDDVWERIVRFWSNPDYAKGFATGVSADNRMKRSLPLGRELFSKA